MKYKILYIFLILLGVLGLIYLYFNDPSIVPFIPCYFHELTGFECTGCGITRAIYSLMHFDFIAAIRYNALFVFSIPLYIVISIKEIRDPDFKIKLVPLLVYVFILLLFTVLRNFTPLF